MWVYRLSILGISLLYLGGNVYLIQEYLHPVNVGGTWDCVGAMQQERKEIFPILIFWGGWGFVELGYAIVLLHMFLRPLRKVNEEKNVQG